MNANFFSIRNPLRSVFTAAILLLIFCAPISAWAQTEPATQTSSTETAPAPIATPSMEATPAPAPPAPEPAPTATPPSAPATESTSTPAPVPEPPKPAAPKLVNLAPPSNRFGDGNTYIGHRYYEEKSGGWGWIKKEGDSWGSAKWIVLKEDPIHHILMPSRKMGKRDADQDYEYKMTGYFLKDKEAYDPHMDETSPIFVLESYQSLGPAAALDRRPGPPMRFTRSKRSRSSSRDDKPVLTGPDNDSF